MAGLIQRERLLAGSLGARRFNKSLWPDIISKNEPFDPTVPDVVIEMDLLQGFKLPLPYPNPTTGANDIEMWILQKQGEPDQFPSALLRFTRGQIVHAHTGGHGNSHTVHWHGIEPTAANDGVGHNSFEIGNYTYQFQPNQAGTYFYHCHKNTVLHFEMGLYGLLIVDPEQGPGFIEALNPPDYVIPYDVEAFWVVDEFDSRWHVLGFNDAMFPHGKDPNDPESFTKFGFLNEFRPDLFTITGALIPAGSDGRPDGNIPISDPRVAVSAMTGQTVLIRLLNAGYTVQEYTLGIDALVTGSDGHSFGVPPFASYSAPYIIPAGTPFHLTSARRLDLIVRPQKAGEYLFNVDFLDWITGENTAMPGPRSR